MLKIGSVSLIGLAVLGWVIIGPGLAFENDPPPPTIRAELGPVKHRPPGYIAEQNQPRVTRISSRQGSEDAPALDVNLRLIR